MTTSTTSTAPKTDKGCSEDNCPGKHVARGYCNKHYIQNKKAGKFTDLRPLRKANMSTEDLRDHIKANSVEEDTGYRTPCWTWTRSMSGPYGQTSYNDPNYADRRPIRAHRLSYQVFNGPLVDGLVVDHMCWHKACVNPEHLRQVAQQENGFNRQGAWTGSTSGVRGVSWDTATGKWRVDAMYNGTRHYGGAFTDLNEAEQAAISLRERISTDGAENQQNRRGANSNSTTGIRGVTWHKRDRKYRAQVMLNGKMHYAGYYDSIEDAEAAVIAKRKELYTHDDHADWATTTEGVSTPGDHVL